MSVTTFPASPWPRALADVPDQALRAVTPGNGESVGAVPDEVQLTFAEAVPSGVRIEIRTPTSGPAQTETRVDGDLVTAAVPADGPGAYTVSYALGSLRGETGFTVLAPGESAPAPDAAPAAAALSIALAVALVTVVALTVRRWMTR